MTAAEIITDALSRIGTLGAGETLAPERLEPAYLRDKVALTLVEQGKA